MSNEDKSLWVAYNGEIYNFLEIKEYLLKRGHQFRSHTDTEIIVHGYEEWGANCVERFNGMFAFALWDEKHKQLFLARDRMGQKPLYYAFIEENIIFASEPKAILRFPHFRKEIDLLALRKYFLFEYVPTPDTIYKHIKRIPAGNILSWHNDTFRSRQYWNISFAGQHNYKNISPLEDLLKDSVEKRLMSDVPLGVFLSGGIDSSVVTSIMSKALPAGQTKTFTIGFSDRSFDESKYAAQVSDYFHTDHYERMLNPDIMMQMIPEVLNFLDEPFADASIIPTYLLSKFTRQHVTVALGGDGGDELFAGYDTFPAHKLACVYDRIPYWIRKYVIEKIISTLPVSLDNMSFDFKLKQFLKGIPYSPEIRNQVWLGSFPPSEHNELFQEAILKETAHSNIFENITESLNVCNAENYLDQILYLYCKLYLQDDILTKVDRASMANSLEVRAPLLDYRFVEYSFGLPVHLKVRGIETKYIFKKIMNRYLPPGIARRAKKGFGIPIAKWIRSDLKELFEEELSERKIAQEGILNPLYVRRLFDDHLRGVKDNRKQLWAILIFELWYKRWFLGK